MNDAISCELCSVAYTSVDNAVQFVRTLGKGCLLAKLDLCPEVSVEHWSFKLAPQLTGKAQQAYAALQPDEAKTYEMVKVAILRRYNINEETY